MSDQPSSLFHSPPWMRVLQQTYGFDFDAVVLEEDGRPVAGVAWCELCDPLGSRRLSLPFCDYCDLLTETPEQARSLVELAAEDGQAWTLRTLGHNLPDIDLPVVSSATAKWMGIDLTADPDVLWQRATPEARKGVRKAERRGVEVRIATEKRELREWFVLHLRLRKNKHGLQAQPYAFFENIWDNFVETGQGFLMIAIYQRQIIGGFFCLQWGDRCYTKCSTSDPDYLVHKPNNLLTWKCIEEAKARGFQMLDMGRNPLHLEGLMAFKRIFGAFDEDMYSVTYCLGEQKPEPNGEVRSLLSGLTSLFCEGFGARQRYGGGGESTVPFF